MGANYKAVAHAEDVTFPLSKLYEPEYLHSFGSMRVILNPTLYLLLMTDLTGRSAELAPVDVIPYGSHTDAFCGKTLMFTTYVTGMADACR